MKPQYKKRVKIMLLTGIVFATIAAFFDWYDGKTFLFFKFTVHLMVFGGLMQFAHRSNYTNKLETIPDSNL